MFLSLDKKRVLSYNNQLSSALITKKAPGWQLYSFIIVVIMYISEMKKICKLVYCTESKCYIHYSAM